MARRRVVIDSNTDTVLGVASKSSVNRTGSRMVMQLIAEDSWDGKATIKRRLLKHPSQSSPPEAVAVSYTDETDDSTPLKSGALTGTTLNTILSVRADCSEIVITTEDATTGALIIEYDGVDN